MCEFLNILHQISFGKENIPYHIITPLWKLKINSMPFY